MRYPHIQQHDEKDCGAACLAMVTEYYGLKLPIAKFRELIKVDNMGANMYGIITGAAALGMEADGLSGDFEELLDGIRHDEIKYPFIARIINELGFEHYIVVWSIADKYIRVGDPGRLRTFAMPTDAFAKQWQGQIIAFTDVSGLQKGDYKKGSFTKFFKYIFAQKKVISFVVAMSLVMSFINIAGSMVFQYVTQNVQSTAMHSIMEQAADKPDIGSAANNAEIADGTMALIKGRIGEWIETLFPSLAAVCLAVIALYAIRAVLTVIRSRTLAKAMKAVDMPLTLGYYDHLMDLPADFYGTRKTGEFMSRFNDANNIRDAISSATLTAVLDSIMAIICGAFLCWLNPTMFAVTLVIIAIYAALMFGFVKPLKDINHKTMEQESTVTSYLKESIDGIETVKAYNYMESAKTKIRGLYGSLLDYSIKGSIISSVQNSIVGFVTSVGVVVLLWIGAGFCMAGKMTLSELFIFYYMLGYFFNPVSNLIDLQPSMQTAMVAAERLNDVLDAAPEDNTKPNADRLSGDIVLSDIDFRYGNRDLVLEDLNLVFKAGEKTALVGESGSGKTTISKLLMAFYKPERGSVMIGGKDLYSYSPQSIRHRIAYISQNTFLFADTVYENLRMGRSDITNEQIEAVCRDCLADEFIRKMPVGYETKLSENGSNLSGGQKQRLAIARALLHTPDILIMDEATSNLDTISESVIQKLIDDLSDDITVIVIAHRLKTVQHCDNIYVMQSGHVVEQGTHDELLSLGGIYAKNWG